GLIATLTVHIQRIRPNNELRKLAGKFSKITSEIMLDGRHLTELQYLVNAISQYQDESEVFKIAIELVEKLADQPSGNQRSDRSDRLTLTPAPGPFTFTRSASEAKDFNKNVTSMTAALRNELYKNVIVDLDNFWTELFLGKDWSNQTYMTEDEMWDWLNFFRENFLNQLTDKFHRPSEKFPTIIKEEEGSKLRCSYFRSSDKCPMRGTNNDYQADFLTKRIGSSNAHSKVHQWSDVRVLGEFTKKKSSGQRNEKFYQLSRLALQVFYTQPLRHFVHGFTAFKSNFELWVFNRSGAYSSGLFNIEDDKEKLVRAICSYLLMSDQELGIDSSIEKVNGRSSVSIYDEKQKETRKFDINPNPFFMVGTIVTRGTTCFETSDKNSVVKYSWVRTPGKSEIDFLQHAHGIDGVVEYVTADIICTIAEGVEVPRTPQLRDRELRRIVISPRGHSLRSSKTIMEFLVGIRDAIVAHRRLYVEKKILHGDISDGNIILATVGGKTQGMLIDLDHAEMVDPPPGKDDNLFLTGTIKFMALERLHRASNCGETIARTFHHDLESFFYVFIVGCITYERGEKSQEVIDLQAWSTENIKSNYDAKELAILGFRRRILDNFSTKFLDFKALAYELRTILFGELGDEYSTPEDYEAEYEKIIKAFSNTIEDLRGKINQLLHNYCSLK
ncbi:BgTH12-01353, partial [Blumeria graminis f. sp. triticale]